MKKEVFTVQMKKKVNIFSSESEVIAAVLTFWKQYLQSTINLIEKETNLLHVEDQGEVLCSIVLKNPELNEMLSNFIIIRADEIPSLSEMISILKEFSFGLKKYKSVLDFVETQNFLTIEDLYKIENMLSEEGVIRKNRRTYEKRIPMFQGNIQKVSFNSELPCLKD